ncbi:MAG: hypothetical protein JWO26_2698 [Rhodospirillales bacterium]|nr:hypothetical protein [Rhodospirillales bacterium]
MPRGTTSPAVLAPIAQRRGKLRRQVTVAAVDVDAVETGRHRAARGSTEIGDDVLDLSRGDLARRAGVDRTRDAGRCQWHQPWHHGLAAGMGEFGEYPGDGRMHLGGEQRQPLDEAVVVQRNLPRRALPIRPNEDVAGKQQPGAAAGKIAIKADELQCDGSVLGSHGFGGRGTDQAVAQCNLADPARCQIGRCHGAAAGRNGCPI